MPDVIFIPNRAGQAELLHSPDGPVGRHLLNIGNDLQRLARRDVGKKSWSLERSISVALTLEASGLVIRVGSDNKIAYIHHEGSRAHIIVPRNASVLRFNSGGQVVFAMRVNHPGTRANRYLSDNLAQAVIR